MIDELDVVVLARDIKKHGLKEGDIGTVVHRYSDKKLLEAEFIKANGETVAVMTLRPDDIRNVAKDEILHVRGFSTA